MQTVSAPVEDTQVTEQQIIMINAALVAEKDTLIIPGRKHPEADTPAQVERFITSVNPVLQQKPALMGLRHRTTLLQDVQQNILQRGLLIVVQEELMRGMAIITFYVRCVVTSAIQVQNGVRCIVTKV